MRRSLTTLLLVATLASCGDGEGEGSAFIRATINGQLWSAHAAEGVVVYPAEDPEGAGRIYAVATRPFGNGHQSLAFNLPLPPDLGTYALDGVVASAWYLSCPDDVLADCLALKAVAAHPGTLTIDRVEPSTGLIEGSFAFDAYTGGEDEIPLPITSGSFRVYAPSVFILE